MVKVVANDADEGIAAALSYTLASRSSHFEVITIQDDTAGSIRIYSVSGILVKYPIMIVSVSVSVSVSAQDGIVALGKAHTRSAPSLSSLPKVALETVPIFVWLNTDRSRPWRVKCRPLPFSTPLSFRRSVL